MRHLLALLLVAAAVLSGAACGNDDEPSGSADAPATAPTDAPPAEPESGGGGEGATAPDAGGDGATGEGATTERGSGARGGRRESARERRARERRERIRSGRRIGPGEFRPSVRRIYYEARSRCASIPPRALARIYRSATDDLQVVADAYADREAPAGEARRAAAAGCLGGLQLQLR